MSSLRDSLSERNVEISRPSTSDYSATKQRPKKSFRSNNVNENKASPSKKSSKHQSASREKKASEAKMSSQVLNASLNDLSTLVDKFKINDESIPIDDNAVAGSSKKKNAKKRERRKLNINPTDSNSSTTLIPTKVMSETRPLNELFTHHISPLYANPSTRYFENISHHPQFQFIQGGLFQTDTTVNKQEILSAPSTPLLNPIQEMGFPRVISCSLPSEPATPRHIQNVLQHPLLSHSLSVNENMFSQFRNRMYVQASVPATTDKRGRSKLTHKQNKNCKSSKNNVENVFEPYISLEEVEAGLKTNVLLEGVLRINPKQFQHAYVSSSSDRNDQDILIDSVKNRNRSLEGDIVVVELLEDSNNDDSNKQKKGKVVYIKEKNHNRTCIGTLKLMPDKNRQKALFVPRDNRAPRLNIPFTSWPDNFYQDAKSYENTLFLAKIINWFDTRFALGVIVCNIGQSGDMVSEIKAILVQNDLDVTPFGPEVRDLFPPIDYVIPEEQFKIREDCRKLCIYSIDPSNCRDIDDALSCVELENGNYEIGVHISDVAHYLPENTILDEKVSNKATTIYLVEKAYHMLPDELCMLCSLSPGVDKLAFSVFWEITKDAQVVSERFCKTVINSCSQLAYDHCQAILEERKNTADNFPEIYNNFKYEEVHKSIKALGEIAAILRRNRFENGALRIDQPKVAFHLDPKSGLPDSFWIYENKPSHQLIEEFMLLANMTVAKKIYEDHPTLAFLRCHPPPSGYMMRNLAKTLKPMGIDLDISSAGELHRSLVPHVSGDNANKGKAMVLNMLCAKPMTRAKYFCASNCEDEDFHHYALNAPLYTHFTSPIRRYADIMVHRLLAASLSYIEVPKWDADQVRMIAAQCNKQKYNAKRAGEMSSELYMLKYIELNSPVLTEAVVVEVREKYIDVIIVAMSLNRRIFFNNDFPGTFNCIRSQESTRLSKMELVWAATDELKEVNQVIEVFSTLQVEMHKGDDMVKVETKLVRPT